MNIEKVELNKNIENFTEKEQCAYEAQNGVNCNYKDFCFVAKVDGEIVGVVSGASYFAEAYIDELVVAEAYRRKKIGTQLIGRVEEYFKELGFNNINTCTNEFQAPAFYEKCGFELEFIRKNKSNPKFNKYFYVKYLN